MMIDAEPAANKETVPNDMHRNELRSLISSLPWHHQIDFGDGLLTSGRTRIDVLKAQASIYFKMGVSGKSVLDIGCWDGFNSFEAHRRGASRVLATDHFAWSSACWGKRESFDLARAHLAPAVEVLDIDIPDLTVESVGRFDVVLFCGVFYHLRHPLYALERIAPLVTETLIVETHMDAMSEPRPAMIFYPTAELANDPTNWWGPNQACVTAMLKDVGFPRVEFTPHPIHSTRGIFHAYRR